MAVKIKRILYTWGKLMAWGIFLALPAGAYSLQPEEKTIPLTLFVSTKGKDEWPGTRQRPFATLQQARDAARAAKEKQPERFAGAVIQVREGVYSLSSSFDLDERDSGSKDHPIVYEAASGQMVRLLGGKAIPQFRPLDDPAVRERLSPEARGHVVQADLRSLGITDFGSLSPRGFSRPIAPAHLELFFKGKPMELARWPNAGEFAHIAGFTLPQTDGGDGGQLEGGFTYEGDRPKRWKPSEDIWAHGYWAYDWANSYERIRRLDTEKRVVETAPPHGAYSFRVGQRFYFINVLEELDRPGEYYLDRSTGMLYFWLPSALKPGEAVVSVLSDPLIRTRDASYLTFKGFTLEGGRGHGIEIKGGSNVTVSGCTVRNVGNWGVMIDGGTRHAALGCDVSHTGDGGISVNGGDRKTLTPAHHRVENNHIHHYARWTRSYQAGVNISGVGIRVAHNLIHDAPHNAILHNGNELTIEYNEIYAVCLESGDAGAIYTGADYTYRGNIIRHNYIHHMGGVGFGTMAVYLDDNVSGHLIYGNVFWKVTRAVFLGGGRDHRVENNLFIDCDPSILIDGRGLDKRSNWQNMIYVTMKERLEAMNWRRPPYSTRYPELAALEKYYADPEKGGVPPENNIVVRNVSVGGEWLDIGWNATPEMVLFKDNLVTEDLKFVDPKRGDFQLPENSPAFQIGFKPIPMEKIGPQKDAHRSSTSKRQLVWSELKIEQAPSVKDGVQQPARIRLTLMNEGQTTEKGRLRLLVSPSTAAKIQGNPNVSYQLKPGQTMTRLFQVMPESGVKTFQVVEHREGDYSPRRVLEIR